MRIYLLIVIEALLAAASFTAALWVFRPYEFSVFMELEGGWMRVLAVALTYLVISYLFDFFNQLETVSRLTVTLQLLQLKIGSILLVQAVLSFLAPDFSLPQRAALLGSVLAALVIIPWRLFVRPALWNAFGAKKVLLVGGGPGQSRLAEAFREEAILGSQVIGSVVTSAGEEAAAPVLGSLAEFRQIVAKYKPDHIIVSSNISDKQFLRALMYVKASGVTVRTVGQAWELLFGRVFSYGLDPYGVIYRNELDSRPSNLALQSIYTNVLGLAAIILALPLMLVIAVGLAIARRGAVFSRVQCIGLHGIPFNMYRFRTTSRQGWLNWLLSRSRLEGLPQVLNLVRGEMALIGPRAERTEFHDELAEMIPFYRQRHHVKPGIFGWSQLHCDPMRHEDTLARLEYDLYYIKHVSVLVDAHVVVRGLRWLLSDPKPAE